MQHSPMNECTEELYDEMLGVLPPRLMLSNAFLVGEPVTHNAQGMPVYDLFFCHEGKFYIGGGTTVKDFLLFCVPVEEPAIA